MTMDYGSLRLQAHRERKRGAATGAAGGQLSSAIAAAKAEGFASPTLSRKAMA